MATTESTHILDSLSDSLSSDDRLLTANERQLLTNVLRHARNGDSDRNEAVARTIAAAIGETIAQRLLEVEALGTAPQPLTEPQFHAAGPGPKMLAGPGPKSGGPGPKRAGPGPKSAGPGPKSGGPGPKMGGPGPKSCGPGPKMGGPGPKSGGPGPKSGGPGPKSGGPGPKSGGPGPKHSGPGPKSAGPGPKASAVHTASTIAAGGGPILVLEEFLAPQELQQLTQYVRAHEHDFVLSEVVAPGAAATTVDFEHRKSRVLFELGKHEEMISGRILSYLPRILPAIGVEPFPIARVEAQITASNHGDFFRPHEDNGDPPLRTREFTFVYFFHREPRPFRGGELRIYDPHAANRGSAYRAIIPQQNQIVFFPSHLLHEITPVHCASRAFADSRFTVNGWFHRPE